MGIRGLNGGWEKISNLDEIAVDRLYWARLIEKSILSTVFIPLLKRGVGAVLFGFQKADKVF